MTEPDIKIPGLGPTIRHIDDVEVPWQDIKQMRRQDGTTAAVHEKWLAFSSDPAYLSIYARYDPGMIVRRHGHYSPHVVFVLEGEIWCGDVLCRAGTHLELPLGAAFGPFVAGDEGVTMLEVMMGDPRSWGDDPGAFEQTLADHGAEALPDPEITLPDWLSDRRQTWVDVDRTS